MYLETISRLLPAGLILCALRVGPVEAQPVLTRLHEFAGYECTTHNTGLIEGRDGLFYGWIGHAGQDRRSVLWRMNRDGSGYTVVHTFTGLSEDGENPTGLVYGSDHVLYGVLSDGGSQLNGILFRIRPDG